MKKLIWATIALVVVVVVSFYQSHRQEHAKHQAFERGYDQAAREVDSLAEERDSLEKTLDSRQEEFEKELDSTERRYSNAIDSLSEMVAESEKKFDSLSEKVSNSGSSQQANQQKNRHEEILTYYKKRYRQLPKDLNAYEHRVALSEIREETIRKFSITIQELNRIRKSNNLDY